MQKTEEKSDKNIQASRVRWAVQGDEYGPVVVFFVGIHGNEPAGIRAVENMADKMAGGAYNMHGSVYAVTGNQAALELGVRFIDTDLNRLWEHYNTRRDFSRKNGTRQPAEFRESLEIKETIDTIIRRHEDKASRFVFADLHTTSSRSCAFILLNDTLENREIARKFPVPQILGIEENIHGTLLSYVNNLGYRAIGFEAGAHNDQVSVERSEAFLWLLMHNAGVLHLPDITFGQYETVLQAHKGVPDTYFEIKYHKLVDDPAAFEMMSGFENFNIIEKNKPLAFENGQLIKAPLSGRIFMPLYQKKGHDGFLIIRQVSEFWLQLSAHLRNSFIHNFLKYLPGVSVAGSRSFEVDLRVARFMVRNIFHLLGYRVTEKDEETLICYKR